MKLFLRELGRGSPAAVLEPGGGHPSGGRRAPGAGMVSPRFEVSLADLPGGRVVAVHGDLDLFTAPILARHLHEASLAGDQALVVDLCETTSLSARGIRVILQAAERLADEGRGLAIACRPEGEPALVLAVLEIDQIIPVGPSPSRALRALTAGD